MGCMDFWAVPSAVNQSWICLNDSGFERCYFLYFQQLNRSPSYCAYIETVAAFVVAALSIPANITCFVDFKKRRVKRELLLLIAAYAISNVGLTVVGAITSIARTNDNFLFGEIGCAVMPYLSLTFVTVSIWSMTLLSFERRARICNYEPLNKTAQRHDWRRIGRTAILLAVILAANLVFWSYPFFIAKVATLLPIDPSVKVPPSFDNDNDISDELSSSIVSRSSTNVCTFSSKRASKRLFVEILFFSLAFIVPILLNVINYAIIWAHVNRRSKAAHFGSKNKPLRREIHLAFMLGVSLAFFVIFTFPFQLTIFYISYDQRHGKKLQSATFFVACLLLYARAAVSPVIFKLFRSSTLRRIHKKLSRNSNASSSHSRNHRAASLPF